MSKEHVDVEGVFCGYLLSRASRTRRLDEVNKGIRCISVVDLDHRSRSLYGDSQVWIAGARGYILRYIFFCVVSTVGICNEHLSNGKLGRDVELMSALYMVKVLWERSESINVS